MTRAFVRTLYTEGVRNAQAANGVATMPGGDGLELPSQVLSAAEAAFIAERDSFYVASVSQTGWPYIQHRGGPAGFLRVLDAGTLGFADYRGNRQYLTLGNIADEDRVALFLMDYAHRRRLKILAHMSVHDLKAEPELATALATPGYRAVAERGFVLRIHAFDWNCPQHITPRFTIPEFKAAIASAQGQRTNDILNQQE